MAAYGYERLRQFPRSERHALAQDIRHAMVALVVEIARANRARDKRPFIARADDTLDALRVLIRLAHQLRFVPTKHYEAWSKQLDEIGRMLGGWARSSAPGSSH